MKYGDLPKVLGFFEIKPTEMFYYHDMPIKLSGQPVFLVEDRLSFLERFLMNVSAEFIKEYGHDAFMSHNMYLSAKHQYQTPTNSFSRPGYHSDGFLTDDINYIWSNNQPTIFSTSDFNLTLDDKVSLGEMEAQGRSEDEITYPNSTLLRLNQYNIHKLGVCEGVQLRLFVKVSFSLDKYDLIGNSVNYLLPCGWEMKERGVNRNAPQSKLNK